MGTNLVSLQIWNKFVIFRNIVIDFINIHLEWCSLSLIKRLSRILLERWGYGENEVDLAISIEAPYIAAW